MKDTTNDVRKFKKAFEYTVKSYCEQIKTLEDLVKFPINNCINGEEYTDYPALKAYKIRSKEIVNSVQKKGKWLIEEGGKNKYTFCYCSNCNSYYTIDRKDEMNYCPDCGAYMKGMDKND